MSTLVQVSGRRRRKDQLMRGLLGAATAVAIVPLALGMSVDAVLVTTAVANVPVALVANVIAGHGSERARLDGVVRGLGDPGGIKSAILGTLELVGLATLIAVPLGIAVALYLVEFGRAGRFGAAVRYFVDVMTGVPSIVFGLFVYITLVLSGVGGGFAGWKGAVALALLMLPIVTRSAEVVLLLVPDSLREAALALGAPRWRIAARVVLPSALPGLITGSLLAIARGAGETAPLLFTATIVQGTSFNLGQRMNSLPAQIFNDIGQAQDRLVARAWGAALTLVLMILALTVIARLAARRSRLA